MRIKENDELVGIISIFFSCLEANMRLFSKVFFIELLIDAKYETFCSVRSSHSPGFYALLDFASTFAFFFFFFSLECPASRAENVRQAYR